MRRLQPLLPRPRARPKKTPCSAPTGRRQSNPADQAQKKCAANSAFFFSKDDIWRSSKNIYPLRTDSTPRRLKLRRLSPPALSAVIQTDRQTEQRKASQFKTTKGGGVLSVLRGYTRTYILWYFYYERLFLRLSELFLLN